MKQRRGSMMENAMSWFGEQAQTQFLDINLEKHNRKRAFDPNSSLNFDPNSSFQKLNSYESLDFDQKFTIRHQIIVWSVGIPDVKSHTVSIMFRVTLFWNDPPPMPKSILVAPLEGFPSQRSLSPTLDQTSPKFNSIDNPVGKSSRNGSNKNSTKDDQADDSYWVMDGRRKAVRKKISQNVAVNDSASVTTDSPQEETVDVPAISIINADTFEVVGQPDVTMLRQRSRLMRFSCMYRARLQQESMNVSQFPHDSHDLVIKLGILSQRQSGARWDRNKWKLGLASESDTQGSVRIPFGVLVDHVRVPGFQISERGLEFELAPLDYGKSSSMRPSTVAGGSGKNLLDAIKNQSDQDFCVKAHIRVKRNSAYYDRNIMPLLDILNLVSISILVSMDANNFFQRGLMCLNIAFVEVGLRTSLDARLPTVGYEIKMQKLLNSYFFSILYIVLESAAMKVLLENHDWPLHRTRFIDHMVAFFLLINQFYLRLVIYKDFSALRPEGNEFNEF